MRKLLQLIFGDLRTVTSVGLALLAALGLSGIAPAVSGPLLVIVLVAAAAIQAF